MRILAFDDMFDASRLRVAPVVEHSYADRDQWDRDAWGQNPIAVVRDVCARLRLGGHVNLLKDAVTHYYVGNKSTYGQVETCLVALE